MIEFDPSGLTGAATIVVSVGAGLLARRGLAVLDAKRDARIARRAARSQRRQVRRVPAGARR